MISVALHTRLAAVLSNEAAAFFIDQFTWWKGDPSREYECLLFGKDCATRKPPVNGQPNILRHCHLMPSEPDARKAWKVQFSLYKRGRASARRTSDRYLHYVQDGERYLLIAITEDPGAHELLMMRYPEAVKEMNSIAKVAHDFLYSQTVSLV